MAALAAACGGAVLFADLPGMPRRGDEVEIGGIRYKVFDIEADAEPATCCATSKCGR